ncbi:MAG: hypothetical protein ABGZ53_08700 [Fuerstiella sp.]
MQSVQLLESSSLFAWRGSQLIAYHADQAGGFLKDASHLIVDRDTSFIALREFIEQNTDTEVVLLPPKSP